VSAEEHPEAEDKQATHNRAAAGCLAVIGITFAGTIVYVVPESGYFVAGLTITTVARKARYAWLNRGSGPDEDETEPVDIVAVLQELGADGQHVLLTRLADEAGLPDTKTARGLLGEASIRVRAVRALDGEGVERNGPGIHRDDIPTPLPASGAPSGGCVCAGHAANANTNNGAEKGPEKGFRVEHTGQAGITVYDLSETHSRRHTAKA
jgi:hypothetical protein